MLEFNISKRRTARINIMLSELGHSPLANIKRNSLGERTEMGDLVNPLASLVRMWFALLATAAEIWRASSKSPAR